MTIEELEKVKFHFVAHMSMEDEHTTTYASEDNPLVIEVRTYLDETNMTPSKLKRYEELAQRIEADGFEDDTAWLGFIHAAQAGEALGY